MALKASIAACKSRKIPPESIFQKKLLRGQYALYHVIIHAESNDPQKEELKYRAIKCLLEAPLDKSARSSAHLACSARSLQGYFSLVRLAKGLQSHSPNPSAPLDIESLTGEVLKVRSTGETFRVDRAIPNFDPRMRVTRTVGTEFVAQSLPFVLETYYVTNDDDRGVSGRYPSVSSRMAAGIFVSLALSQPSKEER